MSTIKLSVTIQLQNNSTDVASSTTFSFVQLAYISRDYSRLGQVPDSTSKVTLVLLVWDYFTVWHCQIWKPKYNSLNIPQ